MAKQSKSEFSFISVVVSVMLFFAITVFVQFIIQDVTETLIGVKPQFNYQYNSNTRLYKVPDAPDQAVDYTAARKMFDQSLLPYESKKLLIYTSISVPIFIVALLLVLSRVKIKSSLRLASYSFFVSAVITVFRLLGDLASYMYRVNQKMAIYGISIFLIAIFIGCIYYIQEKHRVTN